MEYLEHFTITLAVQKKCSIKLNFNKLRAVIICHFFQSGIDITKILSAKKKLEDKRKRHEKKIAKKAKKQLQINGVGMVRRS